VRILVSALSCNPEVGSETLVGFKLTESMAQRHEVVVLASPPSQPPAGATLIPCDAGPCSFNEVGALPLLRFELRQMRLSRALRRRFQFDMVHRLTPSALQLPTWAGNLGKPLVVGPLIAAETPPSEFKPFLQRPVSPPGQPRWHPARLAARFCRIAVGRAGTAQNHLRHAQCILTGTRAALSAVPEPWRSKCRSLTYAGVEHEVYLPPDSRPNNAAIRLLFVGRLIPYKGVELLLRSLAIAAKQHSFHLDLVGAADPAYQDFLSKLAADLGLTITPEPNSRTTEHGFGDGTRSTEHGARSTHHASLTFLPPRPRDQLIQLYQHADIFCFPTICDTYGIALLEAMSCGCAALVSDVAGAGEIVNGTNGLKVALRNPEQYIAEYAQKLIELARNQQLRHELGAAARAHILREHDWSIIGRRLLEIYDDLAAANGNHPAR
jgi:glycosyltransferase involved in cell wall biosynthesis